MDSGCALPLRLCDIRPLNPLPPVAIIAQSSKGPVGEVVRVAALKIAHGYPIPQTYIDRLTSLSGVELVDIGDLLNQEKVAASKHGPDLPGGLRRPPKGWTRS